MSKNKAIDANDEQETVNSTEETPLLERYSSQITGFARDKNNFINSIEYVFNPDNTINWRAMLKPEHLVANRDAFKNNPEVLKDIDISSLPDNKLLILLAGIKELAQIRGYKGVEYDIIEARPDYVAVKCTIDWLPSYETNSKSVKFSSLADAHWDNTHNFAKNFLMAIAENRAFVRAVRNFLKINIVGSDEMGGKTTNPTVEDDSTQFSSPAMLLQKTINDYGITFDQIKDGAVKKNIQGAESWISCDDIPPLSIFTIISGIKKKNKK
jgi:hypothetical protein